VSADMLGLYGIAAGEVDVEEMLQRCDTLAFSLGLARVDSTNRSQHDAMRAYGSPSLPPLQLTMGFSETDSRTHLMVYEPFPDVIPYGERVIVPLFAGICAITRPILARAFRGPEIVVVQDEELRGRLQRLEWWQYLGSEVAERIGRIRLLSGPFYRIEPHGSGACVLWSEPAPFGDRFAPLSETDSDIARRKHDAERYLGITARTTAFHRA
jgi:hypothetical protein